jgi:mutator protein MutT
MNNTVVAVFIKNKKLLMDKRRKSKKVYAGFLMCPSGHINEKESFNDALKREMREELGIDVNKSKYLFTIDDTDTFSKLKFRHNFMLIKSYDGRLEMSREAETLIWMSYDNLMKTQLVPIVKKLVDRLHRIELI